MNVEKMTITYKEKEIIVNPSNYYNVSKIANDPTNSITLAFVITVAATEITIFNLSVGKQVGLFFNDQASLSQTIFYASATVFAIVAMAISYDVSEVYNRHGNIFAINESIDSYTSLYPVIHDSFRFAYDVALDYLS